MLSTSIYVYVQFWNGLGYEWIEGIARREWKYISLLPECRRRQGRCMLCWRARDWWRRTRTREVFDSILPSNLLFSVNRIELNWLKVKIMLRRKGLIMDQFRHWFMGMLLTSCTAGSMFVVRAMICVNIVARVMCHVVRNIGKGNFIWSSTALLNIIYMIVSLYV